MPIYHPLELRLEKLIRDCPHCAALSVTAERGEQFGVVVRHRGYPVGVWSVIGDRLCFRNIAVWEVLHTLADAPTAHTATLAMARGNYWGA
jgi:hypothetical protein